MGNNRQNSGGTSKSAAAPVDQYRRSIGKHQEKLLSDSNVRKKINQRNKDQDEPELESKTPGIVFKVGFVGFWVVVFGSIYLVLKGMMD